MCCLYCHYHHHHPPSTATTTTTTTTTTLLSPLPYHSPPMHYHNHHHHHPPPTAIIIVLLPIQSAEERLDESVQVTNQFQYQLQAQSDHISCMAGRAQTVSKSVNSCMASLNQAMTKMANYEHRLSLMTGRLNSVKGCSELTM